MTLTGGHLNKRKEVPQKHPSSKTMKKAKLSSSKSIKGSSSSKKEDTNSSENDDDFYQNEDDCFGICLDDI